MKKIPNETVSVKLSDDEIIELYFSRDERAITETDRKFGNYLLTIIRNYVRDERDVEECQNDAYAVAWKKIPPERPDCLSAYLAKIALNISREKYKKANRKKRSAETVSFNELGELISERDSVENEYSRQELRRIINDFVNGLSERERFIFVCKYYCADKIGYIAKMLGVSESTVTKELKKLKEKLKTELMKNGYTF